MTTFVGRSMPRIEDGRLLVGQGKYVADIVLPGMVEAAVLRSPYAHARISRLDVKPALTLPGVAAIFYGS